jgi:hypothetical protein
MPTQTKANIEYKNVTSFVIMIDVHRLLRFKPIERLYTYV